MKTTIKLVLISILALSVASCKIMYIPNSQNVPMMEEKGDLKVDIGTKDLQVAFGLTDHVGIMVNGYYNRNDWSVSSGTIEIVENKYLTNRSLIEGGLGYFTTLGNDGRFEVYGGAGYGGFDYNYDLLDNGILSESNKFGINTMRIFLQPALGFQTDIVGFAFSTRLASVNFSNVEYTGYDETELVTEGLNELEDNMFLFVEPALTLRIGFRYAQLQLQPYYNFLVSGPSSINARKWRVFEH